MLEEFAYARRPRGSASRLVPHEFFIRALIPMERGISTCGPRTTMTNSPDNSSWDGRCASGIAPVKYVSLRHSILERGRPIRSRCGGRQYRSPFGTLRLPVTGSIDQPSDGLRFWAMGVVLPIRGEA